MSTQKISLNDRYDLEKTPILLNGTQALVRLMLMQKARDVAAGLNTAGLVTGYRGSPLGAVDMQMKRAEKLLTQSDVTFQYGLNEDLAVTALWGRNRQRSAARANTTASLVCGTARGRGWTAPATRCAMPIWRGLRNTAACWLPWATTTRGKLHRVASIRMVLAGLLPADRQPRRCTGNSGLRHLWLCFVTVFRPMGWPQDDEGYD